MQFILQTKAVEVKNSLSGVDPPLFSGTIPRGWGGDGKEGEGERGMWMDEERGGWKRGGGDGVLKPLVLTCRLSNIRWKRGGNARREGEGLELKQGG